MAVSVWIFVRAELRAWDQSRASGREVWFDGSAVRIGPSGVVLAVWNQNREALTVLPDAPTGLCPARLSTFLTQVGSRDPHEIATFLDAHLDSLRLT